ncbi:MAG: GNAT family N-acetyltransferase [Alphaproteobacteria bacterium]|nr:GNAT family N-acetyltransferase [Alphaproteobacteria bacterium]
MIETENLRIYPASQEQMESFIASQTDEDLKIAYTEMLNGCLQNPKQWKWYTIWMIEFKDKTHIGELCFKGLDIHGVTEIGYGILEEYQGKGYATEAVRAVTKWALNQSGVIAIEAETEENNLASRKVLEKCGFVLNGKMGEEGPRFTLVKKSI